MKSRIALLALGALLAHDAAAASPFSIYFNAEDTSHCSVSGVNSASLLPDGNLLALTGANPPTLSAACGTTNSGTTPAVTLSIAPASVNAGSTPPGSATLTWTANNVTSCNTTGTDSTVSAEFSNAWANATVACGSTPNHCAGGTNTVTLTPIASGADGTYNFGLQCNSGSSGAYATATLAVTGSTGGVGGTACTPGTTGDAPGFTALCSGSMTLYHPGATIKGPSNYSFDFVFGGPWPGAYFGFTTVFTMSKTQFLSIPFTPAPGHTIAIAENGTYTSYPITFSVSTSPGLFNNGVKNGTTVLCAKTNNPNLTITSNSTAGQNCTLNSGTQYWFNVIPAKYANGSWAGCTTNTCGLGFVENNIN